MKSNFLGTRAFKARPSDSKLLAIALSGFVSVTGCGDDEGAAVTPSVDGGASEAFEDSTTEGVDNSSAKGGASSSSAFEVDASHSSADVSDELDGGLQPEPDAAGLDRDADGFSEAEGDCDDFNNTIYPGALEIGADGVDSNCDGNDGAEMTLVWSSSDEDEDLVDALTLFDTNEDGEISLDEFADGCAISAQVSGEGLPGIVQYHASCAGTNGCRGMVLQSWGELYEHSCRGSNYCSGWSCVQGAVDEGRDAEESFLAAHCAYCHSSSDGSFKIPVQPSEELNKYLDQFWDKRSDAYLRSLIAFGVNYISPDGYAVANMPGAYQVLSLAEIDRLIELLRTLPVSGENFDLPGLSAPVEPTPRDAGASSEVFVGDAG